MDLSGFVEVLDQSHVQESTRSRPSHNEDKGLEKNEDIKNIYVSIIHLDTLQTLTLFETGGPLMPPLPKFGLLFAHGQC